MIRPVRVARLFLVVIVLWPTGCVPPRQSLVIALSDSFRTIDPLGSPAVDAASERVRVLIFNSLVKNDDKSDYSGELASDIKRSSDNLTYTFSLRDGIRFHNGHLFTSADAKYTLDLVLSSNFGKSASFYEETDNQRTSYIKSVEAPDARTVVITTSRPWTGLLSSLIPISIIPKDSYATQKDHPIGTGPFKFKSYDSSQQVVDLEANKEYWDGPPKISALRVRVIADMNALQAELRSGRVDLAPLPTSLSPDAIQLLEKDPNLQVLQFKGSNINLLTFNTTQPPLTDIRVRQAIAYAIDREGLVRDLLLNEAMIAHSILPEDCWAYSSGQKYSFDPTRAKQLLDEAGLKDPDGDGPEMRFEKPLVLKVSGNSVASRNCAGVIQHNLKDVGIPVTIDIAELNTLIEDLQRGNFEMFLGQWVGGNRDPVFYKDLVASSNIPTETRPARNRSRFANKEVDALIAEAASTFDREKAKGLYAQIQDIVSREVPIFPLWYQANIVIAKKRVGNIKIDASGNWSFVRNLTLD
jgi:peptide/nickel transport system substrate-binding protein